MAKKPTEPLKLTCHLADGRLNSADGIVMLDGILYHAWFAKHAPHVLQGEGRETFSGYFGLPLYQLPDGYAASKAVYTEIGRTVETLNKRQDFFRADSTDYLAQDSGLISSSVGEYRNYRIPQIIRIVKDGLLTFWCRGHKDEIEDLLAYVGSCGKKNVIGYGIIDGWTVEPCENDYSLHHPDYGLMRPIPVESESLTGYPVMMYSTKPPYWKQSNRKLCYVPIGL